MSLIFRADSQMSARLRMVLQAPTSNVARARMIRSGATSLSLETATFMATYGHSVGLFTNPKWSAARLKGCEAEANDIRGAASTQR